MYTPVSPSFTVEKWYSRSSKLHGHISMLIFSQACEQRKKVPTGVTNDLDDIITMVMQVFVDSYSHIPEHRRHLLFSKLLTVIGEEDYLWRILSLMMGLVVSKGTLKAELTADSQEVN